MWFVVNTNAARIRTALTLMFAFVIQMANAQELIKLTTQQAD
jgi:hypothetical protein